MGTQKRWNAYRRQEDLGMFREDSRESLHRCSYSHDYMPIFTFGGLTWSAKEFSKLLADDGLSKDTPQIELHVCSAGYSLSSKEIWADVQKGRKEWTEALRRDQQKTLPQRLTKRNSTKLRGFWKLWKCSAGFSTPPSYLQKYNELVLPLVSEFVQEMHKLKFKARVRSYTVPVIYLFWTESRLCMVMLVRLCNNLRKETGPGCL